jgi:hypothetical protein
MKSVQPKSKSNAMWWWVPVGAGHVGGAVATWHLGGWMLSETPTSEKQNSN